VVYQLSSSGTIFIPNVPRFCRESPTSPVTAVKDDSGALSCSRVGIPARSAAILDRARSLIGKQFQLNARDDLATDCGGLVIDICKAEGLACGDVDRHYSLFDCGGQALYVHVRSHTNEVPVDQALPGDLLLLSIRDHSYPQHLAIFAGSTIIHSNPMFHTRAVVEQPLSEAWITRVYATFRFRGKKDPVRHTANLHPHVPCERCVREDPRAYVRRRIISFTKTCKH